jgi:hypothetical protein
MAGTYVATVTDANGCTTTTSTTLVDPAVLLWSSFPTGTALDCYGDTDGTVSATATGGTPGYSYTWENGNGIIVGSSGTVTGLGSGVYHVTATDTKGCELTGSALVTEPTELVASITGTNISCGEDGSAIVSVTGGIPGYSYLWDDALGQTTAEATNLPPGTYTVIVTDINGCSTSESVTIITQDVFPPIFVESCPSSEVIFSSMYLDPNLLCNVDYSIDVPLIIDDCIIDDVSITFSAGMNAPATLPADISSAVIGGSYSEMLVEGQTVVTISATDDNDLTSSCSFTIEVVCVPCIDTVFVTDALLNTTIDTFSANLVVQSDGVVKANDDISFFAGQSIDLLPGFEVEANAEFLATIQSCVFSFDSPEAGLWLESLDPDEKKEVEKELLEQGKVLKKRNDNKK